MRITYEHPQWGTQEISLADWLVPTYTGSEQGAVEQVKAELDSCKKTLGAVLALLVDRNMLDIHKAEELAGMHEWYIQYRFRGVKYIQD